MAREREDHAEAVLGDGRRPVVGRVAHDDPAAGGGLDVDAARVADPEERDELQPRAAREDLLVHERVVEDHHVGVLDALDEVRLVARVAGRDDELAEPAERIEMLGLLDELGSLGDDDAHGRAPLVSRRETPGGSRLGPGEALGVPHVRPDVRLDVRQDLPLVVAIVVDPFGQEVRDGQPPHLGMAAGSREIRRDAASRPARCSPRGGASTRPGARRRSRSQSRRSRATASGSHVRNSGSVSARIVRTRPAKPRSSASIRCPRTLQHAPFRRGGVPAQHGAGQPGALHAHGEKRGPERVGDLARRQRRSSDSSDVHGLGSSLGADCRTARRSARDDRGRSRHRSPVSVPSTAQQRSQELDGASLRPRAPRARAIGPRGTRRGRRAR